MYEGILYEIRKMQVKTVRNNFSREIQKLEMIAIYCEQECGKDTWDNVGGHEQLLRRQSGSNYEHFKCTYIIKQCRLIYALVFKNPITAVVCNHKDLLLIFWSPYIPNMGQQWERKQTHASFWSRTQIPSAYIFLARASHKTRSIFLWSRDI